MENQIFLQGTTPSQLVDLINEGVKSQLEQLKKELQTQTANNDLLTREQACELLQIDLSSLWRWAKQGKVKAYGISNRRYFKRSELLESLIPLKTAI